MPRRRTCQEQLDTFLTEVAGSPSGTGNRWLRDGKMEVYVRVTARHVPEGCGFALDIANVNVFQEKNRRKGIYRAFLAHADRVNPFPILFHENVLNADLAASYERRGFLRYPWSLPESPCYYRIVKPDALSSTMNEIRGLE